MSPKTPLTLLHTPLADRDGFHDPSIGSCRFHVPATETNRRSTSPTDSVAEADEEAATDAASDTDAAASADTAASAVAETASDAAVSGVRDDTVEDTGTETDSAERAVSPV